MEKDYALLAVRMADTVPAYEFSRLASLVNDIYDTFVWIEDVKKLRWGYPNYIAPNEEERLYINKADIGTPNFIEFLGVADYLVATTKFLGENYNKLLAIDSAVLISIEKPNTIRDLMLEVKFLSNKKPKKKHRSTIFLASNKSLEDELNYLKSAHKLNKETLTEKNDFLNYVKSIAQISKNILTHANITIIRAK